MKIHKICHYYKIYGVNIFNGTMKECAIIFCSALSVCSSSKYKNIYKCYKTN